MKSNAKHTRAPHDGLFTTRIMGTRTVGERV
jgi:hypothetical protein